MLPRGLKLATFSLIGLFGSRLAAADEANRPLDFERYRTPIIGSESYFHGFATLSFGRGLRFNNPYRLATPVGDTPESSR